MLPSQEIAARYREIWGAGVGFDEAAAHARLEAQATDTLLACRRDERWEAFSSAYTRLYVELPWMNGVEEARRPRDLAAWGKLVGQGKRVLEIGSGAGHLIRYLAENGNICEATEITPLRERGAEGRVRYVRSDGVNLSRFLPAGGYDVVISDQLFEHLHPDDHETHLREVWTLLAPRGRYILRAPHRATGPHDLSSVFGLDEAVFLHLWEPDHADLSDMLARAGFQKCKAVFAIQRLGLATASEAFMRYQCLADRLERRLNWRGDRRRRLRRALRFALVNPHVWVVAQK